MEQLTPNTEDTQELTRNVDDNSLAQEVATSNPLMHRVYLGDHVSDGILSWLSVGVSTTNVWDTTAAEFYLYNDGSVVKSSVTPMPPPS